jgi:hypothetical protein
MRVSLSNEKFLASAQAELDAAFPVVCTSRPDCPCKFCTTTRYEDSDVNKLAREYVAQIEGKLK